MIKLLIGGSPCTYWSIAQKNNRETEASGMGWELFKNYLIAKEKFQPDFFLYENNKSAAQAIKDQIKKELDVYDGTVFSTDSGARYIEINSALVSAQNRQRFYVHNCGDVQQPEDRGILLRDILESGVTDRDKARTMTASFGSPTEREYFKKHQNTMVAEPIKCLTEKEMEYMVRDPDRFNYGYIQKGYEDKAKCITANVSKGVPYNVLAEPVSVGWRGRGGKGKWEKQYEAREDNKANAITTATSDSMVACPVRVGDLPNGRGEISGSQATRIYSTEGKSVNLVANGGGQGAKTGLYAISCTGSKEYPVYEVKDGKITIKGKQYPIKLADGCYRIRKLTVTECCRLQTMPDDYCRAVSNSQAYKGLGNGWTAEVIIHILNGALKDVPKDEEIVVLSMYDGIGTGRYCLDKMGFTNIKYYAYEIDKYAMQVATSNYPDIIECGDAFQVREDDWTVERSNNAACLHQQI